MMNGDDEKMIQQLFFLNDTIVLSLYHDANMFDDYPQNKTYNQSKETEFGILRFVEKIYQTLPSFDGVQEINGFLNVGHQKNPYTSLSCEFSEYFYPKIEVSSILLNESIKFKTVSDFVYEWSGFRLTESPYSIGNTLVFRATGVDLEPRLNRKNNKAVDITFIKLEILPVKIFLKFKLAQIIVRTRYIDLADRDKTLTIDSEKIWDSLDIEVFSADKLIYADYNIYFVHSINLDIGVLGPEVKTSLTTDERSVSLQHISHESSQAGANINNDIVSYLYKEKLYADSLASSKRQFIFLGKGETSYAFDAFTEIVKQSMDELWIFDPYFISLNAPGGKNRVSDIIKILAQNLSVKKKIIFECNADNNTRNEDFKKFFANINPIIDEVKKKTGGSLGFEFIGTTKHFHDRFIFVKQKGNIDGYLVGTSLNSFGENYSTIVQLEAQGAAMVFNKLTSEVSDASNTVSMGKF
jgi:hypothetical protein